MTRTIELKIWLTYDPDVMYDSDDPESFDWFLKEILYGDNLQLFDMGDVGDSLGTVEVIEVDMMEVQTRAAFEKFRSEQKEVLWDEA